MSILRHYFVSDSLDELEVAEQELEARGVETVQIHTLSLDDTGAENHVHLHDVSSFMKKDIIRSGELGALVGAIGAAAVLGVAYLAGWTNSVAGWIPFIFLSIIVFGFSTWEGGFIGIQRTNKNFQRFEEMLNAGKHVFFVDLKPAQEGILEEVIARHPKLELAGSERGNPEWMMKSQKQVPHLLRETLP